MKVGSLVEFQGHPGNVRTDIPINVPEKGYIDVVKEIFHEGKYITVEGWCFGMHPEGEVSCEVEYWRELQAPGEVNVEELMKEVNEKELFAV